MKLEMVQINSDQVSVDDEQGDASPCWEIGVEDRICVNVVAKIAHDDS